MKNSVILKSFSSGISVIMDENLDFDELIVDIANKFKETDSFFKDASVAISLEGRELTQEQEKIVLNTITENSRLNILCIMGKGKDKNIKFLAMEKNVNFQKDENCGQFYRGTLKDGQSIETEHSIIILGDVNKGCVVCSSKDIVILGTLYGEAYAGAAGSNKHFVVALEMHPEKLQINDMICTKNFNDAPAKKTSIFSKKQPEKQAVPSIAFVYNDDIVVEPISSDLLDSFTI